MDDEEADFSGQASINGKAEGKKIGSDKPPQSRVCSRVEDFRAFVSETELEYRTDTRYCRKYATEC